MVERPRFPAGRRTHPVGRWRSAVVVVLHQLFELARHRAAGFWRSRSLSTTDGALAEATGIAQALVNDAVEVSRLVTGGRNSRIWRVTGGGRAFALKQYPSRRDDPRDRLATEVGALRLMERHGIDTVPRVLGVDGAHGFAVLRGSDGRDVAEVGDADAHAAIVFPAGIHGLRAALWAPERPPAAEACLNGGEI